MKKLSDFSTTEALALCQCFGFLLLLFASCARAQPREKWVLAPCDTVTLSHQINHSKSLHLPEYGTQVNSYINFDDAGNPTGHSFCIDSITPTAIMPFKTMLDTYIPENDKTVIIGEPTERFLKRIDTAGRVVDTIYYGLGQHKGEDIIQWSFMFSMPGQKIGNEQLFYMHLAILSESDYATNYESKYELFSSRYMSTVTVGRDSMKLHSHRKWINYPKIFLDKDYHCPKYFPHIAVNKKLDFISVFEYVDSLYVTRQNGEQMRFPIKSRHRTKPEKYDMSRFGDYLYSSMYVCQTFGYSNVLYDSYRDLYYVLAVHPMKYENKDGTVNKVADRRWSLIIFNADFKQLAEIDMPEELRKQNVMITPQGIAIKDSNLSFLARSKTGSRKDVYIIYKPEKR
jgi:hypothetical protein